MSANYSIFSIGKLHNGVNTAAELVDFPNQTKIVDLAAAASYTLALAENGDVYYWGKCKVFVQCLMSTGPVLSQLLSCFATHSSLDANTLALLSKPKLVQTFYVVRRRSLKLKTFLG